MWCAFRGARSKVAEGADVCARSVSGHHPGTARSPRQLDEPSNMQSRGSLRIADVVQHHVERVRAQDLLRLRRVERRNVVGTFQ